MKRALPSPRLPIARSKYESDLNRTLNSWFAQLTTNANDRAVGPAIASGATISPSYPIHHITGSVAVATINVPSGSTGPIRLIADNGFSLATGGNIARAATLQVGEHIDLEYDPATSKWYTAHAPNTVDEVTDGSTYARTLSTYLANGVPYSFQGAWSNVTAYKKGDIVTSGGNTWLATAPSTNSTPSTSNANWQIFGSTGAGTLPSSGPLSDPTSLAFTITNKSDVLLTWAYPTALPADFAFFEIRKGATWASGTFVDTTAAFTYLITDVAPGTTTYWVGIKNLAGSYDATPPSIGVNVSNLPDVTNLTATITNKRDVKLAWTKVAVFKGFEGYEIRVGTSWAAGALVDRTKKSSFVIVDPTPGTNTYWVGVRDKAGNYDANPPSVVATVGALPDVSVGSLSAYFTRKNDLDLRWTGVARFPGFKGYDVYLGGVTISAISEVSSTVTVTTSSNHGFGIGDTVYITGVTPTGYNGAFVITGITLNTFTYTNSVTGLAAGSGGACIDLAVASLLASTRHNHYLVIDPAQGTNLYWIFVTDHAGNLDTFPPWISVSPTANQRGVPNKSILHLFPNAVMDVDGQRIDLPVVTPGTLATYLLSAGGEDFPIDVTAVVQGIVEFFFEAGGVDGNGYWFDFRGDTGAITMGKYVSGVPTTLASGTVPVSTTAARTLHIRMHSNGKFEFQVRNTKIVATDTTFASLGNNVGVGTFAGGPGYISYCTIKGHSGIHPDNQDVNFKAVIDFSQPEGGGAHQHLNKKLDYINDNIMIRSSFIQDGEAFVENGNFEASNQMLFQNLSNPAIGTPPGWSTFTGNAGTAFAYNTSNPFEGVRCLQITNGGTSTFQLGTNRVGHCHPGDVFVLRGAVFSGNGVNPATITLTFADKNFAALANYTISSTLGQWVYKEIVTGGAPAGTCHVFVNLGSNANGVVTYYDKISVKLVRDISNRLDTHGSHSPYRHFRTSQGPTAYWRLNEKGGLIAFDSTGNGHDLGYESVTWGVAGGLFGDPDTGVSFINTPVTFVSGDTGLNLTTLSIEFYIKTAQTNDGLPHTIVANPNLYGVWLFGNTLQVFDWSVNAWRDSGLVINNNVWHHCIVTMTAGAVNFYVDGVKGTTGAWGAGTGGSNFQIGGNANGQLFTTTTLLDELIVYGYILNHNHAREAFRVSQNQSGVFGGDITNTTEDRETGAVTLSTASFIVVAKIGSYTADIANNHLRFGIHANLSITNMTLDNASSQKDSVQWEILVDQSAAVGAAVSGGTIISGPHPVAINSNNTTAGSCSPQISVVGNPPKYVVPDANAHSYSLAIKLVNGGAGTISGATVAGSSAIPSAVLELHELKR